MSYRWFVYPKSIVVLILSAGIAWHLDAYAATLRLNWTDTSNNETGFKVERMASSGSYAQIASVPANVQTYTDTGLTTGTSYCYRIRAYNSAGASAPSNASCTTTLTTTTSTPPSSTGSSTGSTTTSPPTSPSGSIARLSSKWSDYRVSMKIRSADNDGIGLMFRCKTARTITDSHGIPNTNIAALKNRSVASLRCWRRIRLVINRGKPTRCKLLLKAQHSKFSSMAKRFSP